MKVRCFREILKQAKKEENMRIYNDPFYTKTETDGFDYKLKVQVRNLVNSVLQPQM